VTRCGWAGAACLWTLCLTLLWCGRGPRTPARTEPEAARREPATLMAVSMAPCAHEPAGPAREAGASAPERDVPSSEPIAVSLLQELEPAPVQAQAPEARVLTARATAYCPCKRCCGRFADGRTSLGTSAWRRGIASDPTVIPYGARVTVPGYGTAEVDDTGPAMRRSWHGQGRVHIDVRFLYHWQARQWGTRTVTIRVEPPEGVPPTGIFAPGSTLGLE